MRKTKWLIVLLSLLYSVGLAALVLYTDQLLPIVGPGAALYLLAFAGWRVAHSTGHPIIVLLSLLYAAGLAALVLYTDQLLPIVVPGVALYLLALAGWRVAHSTAHPQRFSRAFKPLLCGALVLTLVVGGVGLAGGLNSYFSFSSAGEDFPVAPLQRIFGREEDGLPQAIATFVDKYPEAAPFAEHYASESGARHDMDVSAEMAERAIPLFIQWDDRWGYEDYGGNFLGVNGCGPTCLAMVLCGLTDSGQWNPYEVAQFSWRQGYYTPGSGTAWALMSEGAEKLGLHVTEGTASSEYILKNLTEETPIICSMRPGDFTLGGHYIVLTGIDADGGILVNDPNSPERSGQSWPVDRLIPQIKGMWRYSTQPIVDKIGDIMVVDSSDGKILTVTQIPETPADSDVQTQNQGVDVEGSEGLYNNNKDGQIVQWTDDESPTDAPTPETSAGADGEKMVKVSGPLVDTREGD